MVVNELNKAPFPLPKGECQTDNPELGLLVDGMDAIREVDVMDVAVDVDDMVVVPVESEVVLVADGRLSDVETAVADVLE